MSNTILNHARVELLVCELADARVHSILNLQHDCCFRALGNNVLE